MGLFFLMLIWIGVACFFAVIAAISGWGYWYIGRMWIVIAIVTLAVFVLFAIWLRFTIGLWKEALVLASAFAAVVAVCTSWVTCLLVAWFKRRRIALEQTTLSPRSRTSIDRP